MASRSDFILKKAEKKVTRERANLFLDLGYADAEERQSTLRFAYTIYGFIACRWLTHVTAAYRRDISQPKVSSLANYKLDGFSKARLMNLLSALDQDVEIVIRNGTRSQYAGRISVIWAAGGRWA